MIQKQYYHPRQHKCFATGCRALAFEKNWVKVGKETHYYCLKHWSQHIKAHRNLIMVEPQKRQFRPTKVWGMNIL